MQTRYVSSFGGAGMLMSGGDEREVPTSDEVLETEVRY
jgi:hypothetical protein